MKRGALALLLVACVACAHQEPPKPAEPAPSPPPAAPPAEKGCTFTLEGTADIPWAIMFEKNSDALDESGEKGADEVVKTRMLQGPRPHIVRFSAIGFAEADEQNPSDLSERRARRVVEALAKRGLAAERMEAHGLGTTREPRNERSTLPNRYVAFRTLYEYRGSAQYWAGDHLEPCPRPWEVPAKPPVPACAPPPYYAGYCDGKPAW